MLTFCTLFNKVYLDKGLVLFDSLKQASSSFQIYVLAMDDITYKVLSDQNEKNLIPIKLQDFENDDLLKAKSNRKFGEYCWTCSSWLISYILDRYQPEYCTYIDADMYFYSDPSVIIDEMKEKLTTSIDYNTVDEILKKQRHTSIGLLREAIEH